MYVCACIYVVALGVVDPLVPSAPSRDSTDAVLVAILGASPDEEIPLPL
jgi:hypothetical protein